MSPLLPPRDHGYSKTKESTQNLYLISFSRCPREFRAGLLHGHLLQDCIESMRSAGQSPELVTGTKLFCKPDMYTTVLEAIQSIEASLRPYHVVVTEDLRPLVMQVVKSFPRALKVKCKEEAVIARIGRAGTWTPMQPPKAAEKKFEDDVPPEAAEIAAFLPPFPVPAMDAAFGLPAFNSSLTAPPEFDPALVQFIQEMGQHQMMLNQSLLLATDANQIFQNNLALFAELQQQLVKC